MFFIQGNCNSLFICLAPAVVPPNITTVSTSPEVIYMQWVDIPYLQRNGPLTGYKVRYKKYFDNQFNTKNVDFGFITIALTNLKPFTLYWLEISGYNSAGEGPADYSIIKTLEGGK